MKISCHFHSMKPDGGGYHHSNALIKDALKEYGYLADIFIHGSALPHWFEPCDIFYFQAGCSGLDIAQRYDDVIKIMHPVVSHPELYNTLYYEDLSRWGDDFYDDRPAQWAVKMLEEYAATDYIAIYSDFQKRVMDRVGIDPEKIIKIPKSANEKRFKFHQREYSDNNKITFGYVGQIHSFKGIFSLLDAWEDYKDSEDVQLYIAGSVPQYMTKEGARHKPFQKVFDEYLKRYSNVKYFNQLGGDGLVKFYNSIDFFMMPSFEDVWGMVGLEAMMTGCHVTTTSNAGFSEVIRSAEYGLVIWA